MQATDLLSLYTQNEWIKNVSTQLRSGNTTHQAKHIHIKGLTGSLPAVLSASLLQLTKQPQVFIMEDKEAAAYAYTDFQNLLGEEHVCLYPSLGLHTQEVIDFSTPEHIARNEILQHLMDPQRPPQVIITYPDAITTQVWSSDTYQQHIWKMSPGQSNIILGELLAKLTNTGFVYTDAVYEVGQFAVHGGIIDIFSYANQLPFRVELVGQNVASIRLFDPTHQRSVAEVKHAHIFNPQQGNIPISYNPWLHFLAPGTWLWYQDYDLVLHTLTECYTISQTAITSPPDAPQHDELHMPHYTSPEAWQKAATNFPSIAFGTRTSATIHETVTYESHPQPRFYQQFDLLAENLHSNHNKGLTNILLTETKDQFERLQNIFEDLDAIAHFQHIPLTLSKGYIDPQVGIACYTDHQIFDRYYRYKSAQKYSKHKAITLKELNSLQIGDYVVHIDYGIALFGGLSKLMVNNQEQEVLRLIFRDNDTMYVGLHMLHKITKYSGKSGLPPTTSKLGSSGWDQKKQKVKKKIQELATDLINLYSKRKHARGFSFSPDKSIQAELESSFIYEDTPDQMMASIAVKKDMELPTPMDRLVCGDVGFGKTEVAIRAAFKAIQDQKQVAILVPSTILALQHYNSFQDRLANFKVNIQYVNRFKSPQAINAIKSALKEGEIDILIGTHSILNPAFQFKDLGLLVIDEEQKFGVKAKEYIKRYKLNVDILTLTATPIPRTLHFSLMGARDLSIISTPPANRQPVQTAIHTFDKQVIQDAIHYEVQRGGQVFFVHNRVASLDEVVKIIHNMVPEYRIGVAHGQMAGNQLEKCILGFIAKEYDILISTNIIEAGLDIPNANTIIINDSHMFGLSDLHQMRGRVGRSNTKAFCYLIAPPSVSLTEDARKRLSTLMEFRDLGDGLKVAMRDLDIRGTGNMMGAEQSGFIADIGFETYCKLLDETVQELKETEFKELFSAELAQKDPLEKVECILETDLALLIPTTYVNNDTERLKLYTTLDNIDTEEKLYAFQQELEDRFGPLPSAVQDLVNAIRLRWLAKQLRCSKLKLKDSTIRCYLAAEDNHTAAQSSLETILRYVQTHPERCRLQNSSSHVSVIIQDIPNIQAAQQVLETMIACQKPG